MYQRHCLSENSNCKNVGAGRNHQKHLVQTPHLTDVERSSGLCKVREPAGAGASSAMLLYPLWCTPPSPSTPVQRAHPGKTRDRSTPSSGHRHRQSPRCPVRKCCYPHSAGSQRPKVSRSLHFHPSSADMLLPGPAARTEMGCTCPENVSPWSPSNTTEVLSPS